MKPMTVEEAKVALAANHAERIENMAAAMRCRRTGNRDGFRRCKMLCDHLQIEADRLQRIIKGEVS